MFVFLSANKRYTVKAPSEWKSMSITKKKNRIFGKTENTVFALHIALQQFFFFIFWEIPINLGPIENFNVFGISCVVSISLLNAEAVAGSGGFPPTFALTQERLLYGVCVDFFNADIKLLRSAPKCSFVFSPSTMPRSLRPSVPPSLRLPSLPNRERLFARVSLPLGF